ncbi:MAG: TonB-dependent receptor [Lentisphaerae bacterium]|jgi:iron complex outermembrane receptor protein|nr:TonB-dependent receptor [Lentisphaerota bacterium]
MRGKENMTTKLIAAALAGLAGTLIADQAQPEDDKASSTNEVATLEPITVYASRIDDEKDAMPASVAVFTAEDIEASGARDLPELLKKKAGIDVHALNGNPILTTLAARGFGDNAFGRIKVVIDGEELNNVDMSAPNLTRIPLGSASRVEVIHGPSPVLYGDGAIAGIVNITTKSDDYERKTKITGKAGSQNTFGANFQTKGGIEEEGIQYGASYDYLSSDGYRERSAYRTHTANARLRKNFDNGSSVGVSANYQNAFYELPGSLTRDQWKNGRKVSYERDDWSRIWSYGFGIDSKLKIAEDQWLHIDAGFSHQYRHAKYESSLSDLEYDAYCWHLSPRYINEMSLFDHENKFTAGFDFRYDRYCEDHVSFGYPTKRHFDRARYALFLHDEFYLTEELSVIAGARVERIDNTWSRYEGLAENDDTDWMADCELGLVYRPTDGLRTYVKGSRFHRSAFCDELSYTRDGKFLKPETGTEIDIGAEWEFLKEFKFDVNGYGSIMEDEIFYNPSIKPWGYNANSPAKTRRIGLDTVLTWKRDKVAEASIRYGAVHADFGSGAYHGKDVPYVPNHRVRAEVGFWIIDDLEIKGGYSYTSSQYLSGDYANEYEKLNAYSLFDIGAVYKPSWAKGWTATFVVDNLFDKNYCDYAGVEYYYPGNGRSFLFTLSYEF